MKGCNVIQDNDLRCGKTFNLHIVCFFDPYDPEKNHYVRICRLHYDLIIKELNEEIITLSRTLKNKIYEDKLQRKTAKENDVIYQAGALQYSIDSLRERLKKMSLNQCRNIFCNANLQTNDINKKLYSVISFKPNGRRHNVFYLCSVKCFNIIKGKFGNPVMIQNKQRLLFNDGN